MRDPGLLPHRYPFQFLAASKDELAVRFLTTPNAAASRGERIPPWVLLEVMTQATGVLLGSPESPGGFAVQVQRYRAPRPPRAGDALVLISRLVRRMGPVFQGRTVARVGGRVVAAGTFTIRESAP